MKQNFYSIKSHSSRRRSSYVHVNVVHVFQVSNFHNVRFESLLEDLLKYCVSITVIVYSHAFQAVVVESKKRSTCDVVLWKEV